MKKTIADRIKAGDLPQGYELTEADVGSTLDLTGFGKVLPRDVGKRVWVKSYGFAMENEDQRDARKVREG